MLKAFVRRHTTEGVYTALSSLCGEVRSHLRHRKGVKLARSLRGRQGLKLNIGCGSKLKAGWVNIDLSPKADLTLDARQALPFAAKSCSSIYSEHFLEHLDYPATAMKFLRECHRVLEPGGLFSVGVPDTKWPLAEYIGGGSDGYFSFVKERWHPAWCQTRMEHINYHFRQGSEHRFAYDYETLESALRTAGFCNIQTRAFDPGLDSPDRERGTLYVRAYKPVDS